MILAELARDKRARRCQGFSLAGFRGGRIRRDSARAIASGDGGGPFGRGGSGGISGPTFLVFTRRRSAISRRQRDRLRSLPRAPRAPSPASALLLHNGLGQSLVAVHLNGIEKGVPHHLPVGLRQVETGVNSVEASTDPLLKALKELLGFRVHYGQPRVFSISTPEAYQAVRSS